jgi:hypothetical protein
MRTHLGVVAFVTSVVLNPFAVAQESGMVALEALGSALRESPTWQADYHQEYVAAGMAAGETATGVVVVAWPDRALFRTTDPPSQMMGLDGRQVRLVDLTVPSCDEHQLDDDEWARVPLAAVLDPQGAVDQFTILEHGKQGFVLIPREPGGVDRVEVELGEDNLPREVVVVDPQGATNRLKFTDWRSTGAPPDGSWLPNPPPGLECTDNPPTQ